MTLRMRGRRSAMLIVPACLLVCAGWGPDGHRIVCDIAERYLQPKTKAAVQELLGEQTLADVSVWADELRDDPNYDWTRPLHYINVPRTATSVDLSRDCKDGACVIAAVTRYSSVLRNRKAPREERIEALKFLVHFVADVHQPLHVAYLDDRGGNSIKVTWFGEADWNLHAVWDTAIIRRDMNNDREAMAERLAAGITRMKLRQWRTATNPIAWANESLAITKQLYRDLPSDGILDEAYYAAHVNTVEGRLTAAGVRLAMVLNDVLGDGRKPHDSGAEHQPPAEPATQPTEPSTQPAVP